MDLPAAISQCCFELVEILGKIWGQCPRTQILIDTYKNEYTFTGPFANLNTVSEHGLSSSLTNVFGELDGFNRVISVIKGTASSVFPLDVTGLVLSQFTNIPNYLERNKVNLFASDVTQVIMSRLDSLSETEIKEIDRFMARKTLNCLETFIKIHQP